MSTMDEQHSKIEQFLKRARPPEPSAQLREQVIGAAKKAWKEAPVEIPWQIPLRRLAMSAAAAIVIVSSTNHFSSWSVNRWRADRPAVARAPLAKAPATDSDETWEEPYGPFMQHLVAVRRSPARDPQAVIDSLARLREAFQDVPQSVVEVDESDSPGVKSGRMPAGVDCRWHA